MCGVHSEQNELRQCVNVGEGLSEKTEGGFGGGALTLDSARLLLTVHRD